MRRLSIRCGTIGCSGVRRLGAGCLGSILEHFFRLKTDRIVHAFAHKIVSVRHNLGVGPEPPRAGQSNGALFVQRYYRLQLGDGVSGGGGVQQGSPLLPSVLENYETDC